ncbi:MAG: 4-alpha-glucanotransferase [Ilumatobacteraceae bacterium]
MHRLPPDLPIGYHELRPLNGGPATRLFVAPERCPAPPSGWGVAAQLYATFSRASQGIGDLVDLADLAEWVERAGGRAILLSPLHAPNPTTAQEDSPYYASSRVWRNPLHLRVDGVPASRPSVIDRDEVWAAKRAALWQRFTHLAPEETAEWEAWAQRQGASLGEWSRWCAGSGAPTDPREPTVPRLAAMADRWSARQVRHRAPNVSPIGDLAVGFSPDGADAASLPTCSPPVPSERRRMPSTRPDRTGDSTVRAVEAAGLVLRTVHPHRPSAASRGLQGLRIDHVMGLFRQYWIPPGANATQVPMSASARRTARHRRDRGDAGALVVGEDLGTVEPGFAALRAHGVLGTTVAWFHDGPPPTYPAENLATLSTHDLPTVAGVWRGLDGDEGLRNPAGRTGRRGVVGGRRRGRRSSFAGAPVGPRPRHAGRPEPGRASGQRSLAPPMSDRTGGSRCRSRSRRSPDRPSRHASPARFETAATSPAESTNSLARAPAG